MPSSAIDKPGRAIDPRALPNRHGRQPASRLAHRPPAAPGSRHALLRPSHSRLPTRTDMSSARHAPPCPAQPQPRRRTRKAASRSTGCSTRASRTRTINRASTRGGKAAACRRTRCSACAAATGRALGFASPHVPGASSTHTQVAATIAIRHRFRRCVPTARRERHRASGARTRRAAAAGESTLEGPTGGRMRSALAGVMKLVNIADLND